MHAHRATALKRKVWIFKINPASIDMSYEQIFNP